MMRNPKSIFPLTLALLLLLAMIAINPSVSTDVQAGLLTDLNPQPPSQSSLPDNPSRDDQEDDQDEEEDDDDDDDGGENDDDDEADDDDDDGEADDGGDDNEEDEYTPPPSRPNNRPPDDQDKKSEPTDYVNVIINGCKLTCSASFNQQKMELLAQVQLVHEGSGFVVEGIISNQKSTRFSVPYPGKWELFLMARPQIISAEPMDDPQLQAALAASFKDAPIWMGTVEANTATPQFVKCPLLCRNPGPASDRGVQPVALDGNPQDGTPPTNCGVFGSDYQEFRLDNLDSLDSGNYSDGFLSLDIVVTLSDTDGPSFDWSIAADSSVQALPGIFVKGGNGGNWYDYSAFTDVPEGGATYDGSLHSPVNPQNGKFFGLSHVSFCYLITPEGGNEAGDTDTNTPHGLNGAGDTTGFNNQVRLNSGTDEVTANSKPSYLPETGGAQPGDNSLIAAFLIIGGLSLTVIGLFCRLFAYKSKICQSTRISG